MPLPTLRNVGLPSDRTKFIELCEFAQARLSCSSMEPLRHQTSLPAGHPYIPHLVQRVTLEEVEERLREEASELARFGEDDADDHDQRNQGNSIEPSTALLDAFASDEDLLGRTPKRAGEESNRTSWDEEWQAFKACLNPGDELWHYCSPQENWDALCGSEGYVIIRDGRVVRDIEMSRN